MSDRFSDTTEIPLPPEPDESHEYTYYETPQNGEPLRRRPPQGQHPRLNGAAAPRVPDPFAEQPQRPVNHTQRPVNQPQRSVNQPQRSVNQPQRNSTQQRRQLQQPPRQRLNQPPAYPPPASGIRRASYQGQMPENGKSIPYRRPPQQYRQPEFEEELPEKPTPPKKKKRRRHYRHSCLRRIIFSIFLLFAVLFGIYSGIAMLAIKQLEYEETGTRAITAEVERDADIRNILLIGTDNREDERGRADTMILLSFSKHNKSVTMTSLMRDCYVSIPNFGTDKLNAAYAYGGATLLMDTITHNFGIPIDDYICVNFKAFVHIADAIGGIKVAISDREAEAINVILQSEVNEIMGDDPLDDFLPSGGTFLLNGKQALAYARIRYVGNADFERTERQRTVLNLMLDKMKHLSPSAIPKILVKALPELKTNVTSKQLYLMSLELPVKLIAYDMQKLRLPADGTFSDQTSPDGQMVLAVDFDANLQLYLKATHDPLPEPEPEGEVSGT